MAEAFRVLRCGGRGATADPSVPAKVRAEHEAALKRAAKEGKDAAMIAAKAAEDMAAEEQAERQAIFEHAAEAETQLRRLSFFGRPVQKFRVIMRERQTERQEREHQAAMFAHLREDAQTEYKLQASHFTIPATMQAPLPPPVAPLATALTLLRRCRWPSTRRRPQR